VLRLLDCFSGIGGFSLAARWVGGFQTVQFVELDPFCQQVLRKHWPEVPTHDDIRSFTAEPGSMDVITAGFPCQDLSSAGKQQGLSAERSGLFYEVIRLARELRPQFVVFENVANLVSHGDGETFQEVLFQIARAGFDAEWAVVSARDVGACHLRKRVWIVAYAQSIRRGTWEGQGAAEAGCEVSGASDISAGSDAAHANNSGLQGRQSAGVCEYPTQWSAWQGNTSGGRLAPEWRSYVSQPVLCRGDDGLLGRVDRLKALGNAVVPQVAMIPLQRVKALAGRR
jgi:DNA (cytosine-5)-methyltransferase 1